MSRIDKRLLDASERKIMGQGERYQGFSRNMLQFIMPKISTLANHFWKFYSGENLWKFSFYFWKLGPLPWLFSFLELVLFGWTKFKVETHKSYWPVRDPSPYPFMYHLTDLTEMVLL